MPDEEIQSVDEEVAQPTESEQQQDDPQAPIEEKRRPISDVEYNWRETRRKMDDLERRNYELESRIAQLSGPRVPQESLESINDDEIITAKQAKQLARKMAKEVAEEAIREREAQTMDDRILMKYPDFSQVVTRENIEQLKNEEPELARSLHMMASDPYAQSIATYKILKKHVLGDNSPSTESLQNKKRAIENSKKPVSVQTVGRSAAITNATGFQDRLTPDRAKALWQDMQQAMKGY